MIFLRILFKKIIYQELIILKLLMLRFKNLIWWRLPYKTEELELVMVDLELDLGHHNKMSRCRLNKVLGFKGWELLFVQNMILKLKQQERFRFQILFLIRIDRGGNHQLLWINKLVELNQQSEGVGSIWSIW